jgi:1-acyl-sn-glycerol-3-phosphate acyltransferase
MRVVRAVWRLAWASLHLGHGIAVMALRFPFLDEAGRARCIQWWSATLLRRLGLRWHCEGTPRPGATLLVANHISWLDIAAIHAACPQARFVSKADVKRWPLIGWLVGAAGTLFIERERKRDALRVVHQMAEALRAGRTVAVSTPTCCRPPLRPKHRSSPWPCAFPTAAMPSARRPCSWARPP